MKKKITSLAIALILGLCTTGLYAGINSVSTNSIIKQVKKELRFPDIIKGEVNKTKALVSFVIDDKGKIIIREINAEEKVKEYLENTFESMYFVSGTYETGKEINLEIFFSLL